MKDKVRKKLEKWRKSKGPHGLKGKINNPKGGPGVKGPRKPPTVQITRRVDKRIKKTVVTQLDQIIKDETAKLPPITEVVPSSIPE